MRWNMRSLSSGAVIVASSVPNGSRAHCLSRPLSPADSPASRCVRQGALSPLSTLAAVSSGGTLRIQEEAMPSEDDKIDRDHVVRTLNTILEFELAGVVRYVHYSLMVFGHARIPIIGWMRNQAIEGMNHASIAGEHVRSEERRVGK